MLIEKKTGFIGLGALGLSLVFAAQVPVAGSETATDVICIGCVQGTDIQDGTIGPNKLIPGSINATTIANGVIGPNKLIPGSINTSTIANDAIRSNKILDGAVQSVDIRDNDVRSIDIQDGGVTSVDIQDGTITQADIATNGVASSEVLNNSLTANDLATNSVGSLEIQGNAVGQAEITTGGVASNEVLDNSLTANDLATNSVGALEIQSNAVGQAEIAVNGVASSEVQNNSLFDFDMADEAGVEFVSGDQNLALAVADTIARTVTVTAPTSGFILANASGYFNFLGATTDTGRCSITTGVVIDFSHLIIAEDDGGNTMSFMPFGATRVFSVSAGNNIIRLVCDEFAGSVNIGDSSLNALFVSTRY